MKKPTFIYSLIFAFLALDAWSGGRHRAGHDDEYPRHPAGGAGSSAYGDDYGRGERGGGGSGASSMPSRGSGRENITFTCANAALAAYPDDGGAETTMYLVTQGYSVDTPNERVLIAKKGEARRGAVTSNIMAFRGSETMKDWDSGKKVLFGTGWNESVDMIGGRPIPRLMEENGVDGKCISSYAEIFNSLLSDIQGVLYKKGDSLILTGHSMGGVLAQYAALEGYAKLRTPVDSVVTFGSPAAFEGPIVSFFDSIIPHERYYFSGDWAPKLGSAAHTGTAHRLGGSTHSMLDYLDAIESSK